MAPLDLPHGLVGQVRGKTSWVGALPTPEQPAAIAALITDFQRREQHLGTYN